MTVLRDDIPAEILQFLHEHIDSVEQLQVLLLLAEHGDAPRWTVERLSGELRSTPRSVQNRLQQLRERGVLAPDSVQPDGQLLFRPASPLVAQVAAQLVELYRLRPHRVIAQIFSRPSPCIRSFADSFKLKKEEEE